MRSTSLMSALHLHQMRSSWINCPSDPTAKLTADKENVDIRLYKVIYNAIEDVEAAMKGMLDPVYEEKY